MKKISLIAVIVLLIAGAFGTVNAQQKKRVIQLSGVVLEEDSVSGPSTSRCARLCTESRKRNHHEWYGFFLHACVGK